MAKLLSNCWSTEKTIPESYVFPPEKRPGEYVVPIAKANVSIIDLLDQHNSTMHVMQASQNLGLFQVINHGVPSNLMNEAMKIFEEVFNLPPEEKSKINNVGDSNGICRLYTSSYNYSTEETHYWRDALRHSCSPLEECINYWPQKLEKYREIVGAYVTAVKELGSRILELVCQGLGLERGYLASDLNEDDFLTINYYPSCPNPRLTLGLSKHSDPNLITILLQGHVPGLQVFKDGQWLGVEPLPNAFVVIIGNQLEIISNGKLKSGEHRAVTNAKEARTSAAFFINPSMDSFVQPAKGLLQQHNTLPQYKPFQYKDFFKAYTAPNAGNTEAVLEAFKIKK